MTDIVSSFNVLLSLGTIGMQLVTVALLASYVLNKEFAPTAWLVRRAVPIAFLLALAGTAITLLYSDVFGFVPCGLCWLQRVFLYPQVVILGIALWYKRNDVAEYVIGLSVFGAVFALYQHYLQMGGTELVTCPTVGGGADCSQRFLFEFGYITFPFMAFSMFAFLIVLMLAYRRHSGTFVPESRA